MGCSQSSEVSTPSNEHDVPPRIPAAAPQLPPIAANNASQQQDNSPLHTLNSLSFRGRSRTESSSQHHQQSTRPNQPIRAPSPVSTSPKHVIHRPPPWSRSLLEKERADFFDTRVTGRQEVWDALRLACDVIRHGDLAEAQGILDAINVTCPHGRVASGRGSKREKGGLYDEYGALYEIPPWILADPTDVIEDEEKDLAGDEDDDDKYHNNEAIAVAPRRDEKGKGRAEDIGELVSLRARLSDQAIDITVEIGTKQRLSFAITALEKRIGPRKRVRLAYLGKVIDENSTLEQTGWATGHVVNALVFDEDIATMKKTTK
ncbi:Hypothetical protein R9X50_00244800 [Acrodontium crateriforme]|uniref:DC-UbP/UBTD2 N-terminal domain-containing protein n=1 Tax=Acrodontium crateriforme TaxID=150365 RepID=A0AAQ3R3H2_9PEZI|nr:Hypothetical protein R9X50_00244800 [Acrodontium crateriforme]